MKIGILATVALLILAAFGAPTQQAHLKESGSQQERLARDFVAHATALAAKSRENQISKAY